MSDLKAPVVTVSSPAPVAPPVARADEFAGMGGSYELDPATGVRRLVARTQPDSGAGLTSMPALTSAPDAQKE
jgi:hypothetical protein